jgi:hypothetical protein
MVCASMRDCPNGDDLVAEFLLGPDAKMNWDPKNSHPDFYRIVQPTSQPVIRSAAVGSTSQPATMAEARSRAHFGDPSGSNPHMRPSYPERSTKLMTAEEVRSASDQQSIGRPLSRPSKSSTQSALSQVVPESQQQTLAKTAAAASKKKPSTLQKQIGIQKTVPGLQAQSASVPIVPQASDVTLKRKPPTQFNGSGRVVRPAKSTTPVASSEPKTVHPKRSRDLPLTASMMDFMLLDKP